ncbi:hypothetical protein JCM10212_000784, partial [Sporobolomyces blumeae]
RPAPTESWKHDMYNDKPAPAASAAPGGSLAARLSGAAAPAGNSLKTTKLIIRDLHYEVSERELELLFVQIGPLASGPKIKVRPSRDSLQPAMTPLTQFDRSGRSEGMAWLSYTTPEHATQAKEAFDGALAKGQNIKVEYDTRVDRTQPAPGSLLARLDADPNAPKGPRNAPIRGGRPHVGPQRGVGSDNRTGRGPRTSGAGDRDSRGERSGGGERGGRGGGGGAGRFKREPKTNDDLDRELEAFMKKPESSDPAARPAAPAAAAPASAPAPVSAPAPQADAGGDVEMA